MSDIAKGKTVTIRAILLMSLLAAAATPAMAEPQMQALKSSPPPVESSSALATSSPLSIGQALNQVLPVSLTDPLSSSDKTATVTLPIFPSDTLNDGKAAMQLYQIDNSEIGARTPLLLVHGLHGERRKFCHWAKLLRELESNPGIARTYKIFAVRYGSERSLSSIVPELRSEIRQVFDISGHRPVTLLALSFGGNLVQESMREPEVDSMVRLVLTLGTPFHGSPLFSSNWFQYSLYKSRSFILTRYINTLIYRAYISHNKQLTADLRPDNTSGLIPNAGAFQSKLPFGPRGDLIVDKEANGRLLELNQDALVNKNKFVTYAGYMDNSIVRKRGLAKRVLTAMTRPYVVAVGAMRLACGEEHGIFRSTNQLMGRAPINKDTLRHDIHPFALNDGVTPLASALFLPNSLGKDNYPGDEASLQALARYTDVGKARAFRGVDHITFVDGIRPPFAAKLVKDQLHPNEGKRPIFDWIIDDLLNQNLLSSRVRVSQK